VRIIGGFEGPFHINLGKRRLGNRVRVEGNDLENHSGDVQAEKRILRAALGLDGRGHPSPHGLFPL
jgi:hypothetical protein